jgi:hypothetical protein
MNNIENKVINIGRIVGGDGTGKDGKDGFSPITKLEDLGDSVRFTVTDATHSDSVEIAKGKNGEKGEDGFSPVITVDTDGRKCIIHIQNKDSEQTTVIPIYEAPDFDTVTIIEPSHDSMRESDTVAVKEEQNG